jgi:hypothetical protein
MSVNVQMAEYVITTYPLMLDMHVEKVHAAHITADPSVIAKL